jgi:hypothetical protein
MNIDSQWWRCIDGYRLGRTDQRRRILPGGRSRPLTAEEEAQHPPRREEDRYWLKPNSARHEEYRPMEIPGLYSMFADAAPTPKGMRDFANLFGPLSIGERHINPLGAPTMQIMAVSDMLREHSALRHAVGLLKAGQNAELTKYWNTRRDSVLAQVQLKMAPGWQIQFSLTPPSLIQAIWLQLAADACSGAQLFRCERCGTPFTVGTGTGRRNTAKYCSNACKVGAYQERRRAEEARA